MLLNKVVSISAFICSVAIASYDSSAEKSTIIVDAGSTGSRLNIYQYTLNPASSLPVVHSENSSKLKGGIQEENSDSVDAYLKKLFGEIKSENINNIYFYSTAGMRQVSPNQRASLNKVIGNWLRAKFPRSVIDVQTIPGQKEALYAWLALNYSKGLLGAQSRTQGILEMGGASTQIAYEVENKADFIVKINNKVYKLNAESFLGLGIDQAMDQFLNQESCFPKGYPLPDSKKGTGDYDTCTKRIEPLITIVHEIDDYIKLHPPKNTDSLIATAGFDYTATELSLGEHYSVRNLNEKGKDFCKKEWNALNSGLTPYPVNRFLWHYCFDAAFESDLLTYGYRLNTGNIPVKTASEVAYKSDWVPGVLLKSFVTPLNP